jgi:ribulose-phosphate 3-epimerase
LRLIQGEGAKAGVVINPATPVQTLTEVLHVADYVLVMSVNPGFGAQSFLPNALQKVRALDAIRRDRRLNFAIQIDGGVNEDNLREIVRAGCDWVVAGSTIFDSEDPAATVARLQQIVRNAHSVPV